MINQNRAVKRLIYISSFYLISSLFFPSNAFAQCAEPDASIWLNTWVSCEVKENPIADYGETHWIQYDFGSVRTLSKSWVWNSNDPNHLDQGFKQVKIDYSENGQTWNHWGEMNFPKGEGKAVYGGFPGPDLVNIKARYVLLTAISTHGADCAGLAEVKFNLLPEIIQSPRQFHCETAPPISRFFTEYLSTTEAFIYWRYDIPDQFRAETEYVFEIRPIGTTFWQEMETDDEEIFLEELAPNTTYEYRVVLACDDQAIISETKRFTTLNDISTDTDNPIRVADRMTVSPNPTQDDFVLNYFSHRGGQLNYSVRDLQGKTLFQFQTLAQPGDNNFSIDLGQFPDGVYLVNAFTEQEEVQLVERIVKMSK